jgi:hypothetical protein
MIFRFAALVTIADEDGFEFTWTDNVRQFYPIAPAVYSQLLMSKPMYLFLNRVLASRSVREQRVRTEAGRVLMRALELEELIATA